MDDLTDTIQRCIKMKHWDKEFALFFAPSRDDDPTPWMAVIGNRDRNHYIPYGGADFTSFGKTAREAVVGLLGILMDTYREDIGT